VEHRADEDELAAAFRIDSAQLRPEPFSVGRGMRKSTTRARIDVLVNNDATFTRTRRTSPDGHELMLATNHLSPLLFTLLPKDALLRRRVLRLPQRPTPIPRLEDPWDVPGRSSSW